MITHGMSQDIQPAMKTRPHSKGSIRVSLGGGAISARSDEVVLKLVIEIGEIERGSIDRNYRIKH